MVVGESLRAAAAALAAVSDTPRLDAELLMAQALGTTREALLLRHRDDPVPAAFAGLLGRRLAHEPVAYITGTRAFWTNELAVGPGVLIPRPDSETLVEAAVAHFGAGAPATVLDLGTGSGALLLAALAEWPGATGVGIDASPAARAWAEANVGRLGFGGRARIVDGGWEGTGDAFDLVLCNPPYIVDDEPLPRQVRDHEPAAALFAGPDGRRDYRALAKVIGRQIAPGGVACVEIGATQAEAVAGLLGDAGLPAELHRDLAGRPRCITVAASGRLDFPLGRAGHNA